MGFNLTLLLTFGCLHPNTKNNLGKQEPAKPGDISKSYFILAGAGVYANVQIFGQLGEAE